MVRQSKFGMFRRQLKKIFSSIRMRYAATAMLFAMIILFAASLANFSVTGARHSTASSIEGRQQLLQRIRHIRNAIWQSYERLEMFLFNPNTELYQENIHAAIDSAILHTERLNLAPLGELANKKEDILQLRQLLFQFDETVSQLVQIRTDAVKQYPALELARGVMLTQNKEFITATGLAILESTESLQTSTKHQAIYQAFVQARHHWTQMTSNFRMYLANRLGTFDNSVFQSQVNDIDLQLGALKLQLKYLQDHNELLDLQGSTSLGIMFTATDQWYRSFLKVKRINESDAWRTDAKLISDVIEPLLDQIWSRLVSLDTTVEASAEKDVKLLTKLAQSQTNTLWLMAGLAILFVLASYILLDKSVLRPLSILTAALKAEAHNETGYPLPEVTNIETQNLMDAFDEMRKQIHNRQKELEYQALHDSLTGLANRNLLLDRMQQAVQQVKRHKSALSLLIIDLDGFKDVNDTLGHQVGDRLLEEVGLRLTRTLREIDTVARLGGDEFAILLPDDSEQQAVEVAQKILNSLETEFTVHDVNLFIGASIGIASCPKHSSEVQDLIKFADVAMYVAKRNKLGYSIYDATLDTHSIGQLAMGSDLRNALGTNTLSLVYQPKVDIHTGQVRSVEALFRWTHPTLGPIAATEAINLAEQTGYINQLTMWIIDTAAEQHHAWMQAGFDIPIAINLSVYSLQSEKVIEQLILRLSTPSILRHSLSFELTESAMMVDPQHAIQTLNRISALGASISVDDFGTGFSSLSYLKKMPVNELKVDKSFVLDMVEDENDASIVRSIIDLAHNLGLKVVAEGVENKQTWQRLKELKCDTAQGFFICRPLEADKLLDWYRLQLKQAPVLYSA